MVVDWKQTRIKRVPCLGSKTGKDHIDLLPGLNQVDDSDWALAKNHLTSDHDKQFLKEVVQEVEVKSKETGKKTTKKTSKFIEFSPEQATKAIEDCFNVKTLQSWKRGEERTDIRFAIDERIKEIKEKRIDEKKIVGKGRDE